MEGLNIGAILLAYLGLLVLGLTSLTALGLLLGRRTTAARITLASGIFALTIIAALAALSFLQRGMGFYEEGSDPTIILMALTVLLAGAGQFTAALSRAGGYGTVLACACAALALAPTPFLGSDVPGWSMTDAFRARSLSLPWLSLGLVVSLLLATASVLLAVLLPQRRKGAVLGLALAALGGIGGFAAGDACVTTRCTVTMGLPGGEPQGVHVEVTVFGEGVNEADGFARMPPGGLGELRAITPVQAALVYGPPTVGALAGLLGAWILTRRLAQTGRFDQSPALRTPSFPCDHSAKT